jgi:hypothetical protein
MKIRNGFVSNSSSSSYILGFLKGYTSFEEFIKHGVFPWINEKGNPGINSPVKDWKTYGDNPLTYRECFSRLYDDLCWAKTNGHKANFKNWHSYITGGTIPSVPSVQEYDFPFAETSCAPHNLSNYWDRKNAGLIERRLEKTGAEWNSIVGTALFRDWRERYGREIYVVQYSDNEGSINALMEHGDFWQYIRHIRFSLH